VTSVPRPDEPRPAGKPFCEGGTETCEQCVGSCGIEEYEEGCRVTDPQDTGSGEVSEPMAERSVCGARGGGDVSARESLFSPLRRRIWTVKIYPNYGPRSFTFECWRHGGSLRFRSRLVIWGPWF